MAGSQNSLPYIGREVYGLQDVIQQLESEVTSQGAYIRGVNSPPAVIHIGTQELKRFARAHAVSFGNILEYPQVEQAIGAVRRQELVEPQQRFPITVHPVVWKHDGKREMYILGRIKDARREDGKFSFEQEYQSLGERLGIPLSSKRNDLDLYPEFKFRLLTFDRPLKIENWVRHIGRSVGSVTVGGLKGAMRPAMREPR